MELPPLVQKIIADVSSYEKGLNAAGQAIKRFQTRAASVEQFGRTIGSGMVEGIDKIRAAWDSASAAAMRYASAFQNLNLASASSNMAANLAKQAEALKQITGSPAAMARFAGTAYSKGRLAIDPDEAGRYAVQALREQISVQTKAAVGAMGRVRVPLPMAGGPGRIATPLMDTVRQAVQGSQEALATGSAFQTQQQSMKGFSRRLAEGARSASRAARPEEIMEVFGMSPQGLRAAATAADLSFSTELGKIRSAVGRGGGKKGATAGNMAEVFGLPGPGAHLPANLSPAALNVLGSYVDPDRAAARSMRTPDGAGGGGLFGKGGALKGLASRVASGFFLFSEFRQTIDALKEGVNQYVVAMVHAHAEMATSAVQGLHSAASGFVRGIGRALGGFVDEIKAALTGGDLSAQFGGAGGLLSELVGAVGDAVGGAISGAGEMIQGAISAQVTKRVAGIQLAGGIGQAVGHGTSLAGGAALAGGMVSGPVGLGTVLVGQAIAAGSQIVADQMAAVEKAAGQVLQAVASMASGIAGEIAGVVGGLAAKMIQLTAALAGSIAAAGVEAQRLATAFGVLVGDMGRGRSLFSDLQNITLISPYSMTALNDASQTLLGMGMEAQDLTKAMKVLGDVAVGDEGRLKRLAMVYGEVMAEGKMTGWRIRQLASLGVGVTDMAKAAGIPEHQFRNRLSAGGIPPDIMRQVMNSLTAPGGRMFGMNEMALNTTGGRWSQLANTATVAAAKMGEAFNKAAGFSGIFGSLTTAIAGMTDSLVEFARKVGSYFGPIVKEFLDLAGAVGKTVVEMMKMSGFDFGDPTTFAKQLADSFKDVAGSIMKAGAEVLSFLGRIIEMLRVGLVRAVAFVGETVADALITPMTQGLLGNKKSSEMAGHVLGLTGRVLQGLGVQGPITSRLEAHPFSAFSRPWTEHLDFTEPQVGDTPGWLKSMIGLPGTVAGMNVQQNRGWLTGQGAGSIWSGGAAARTWFGEQMNPGMSHSFAQLAAGPNLRQEMLGGLGALIGLGANVGGAMGNFIPIHRKQWESNVTSRYEFAKNLAGKESLADRLTNANVRGSEGAYETFARSFAQQQSPMDFASLLQAANDHLAEIDKNEKMLLEFASKLDPERFANLFRGVGDKPKPAGVQP